MGVGGIFFGGVKYNRVEFILCAETIFEQNNYVAAQRFLNIINGVTYLYRFC